MNPFYALLFLALGALLMYTYTVFSKLEKADSAPESALLEGRIESLKAAVAALVKELEILKQSNGKVSRIENSELFDRIEALEKASKRNLLFRHEHYFTELPKLKRSK